MRDSVDRSFTVDATRESVWNQFLEVPRVASWLPILHTVVENQELLEYQAVLEDRIGHFSLRADLLIEVSTFLEPYEISITARGEDRQVRSQILIEAFARLKDDSKGGTVVTLGGSYEITGRVATLGAGIIRSKATKLFEQFCTTAQASLS